MLKNLSISNYALIEKLEMTPSASLNMITGETGAGKSIMLGAVGLLLGNRADTKALFNQNQKCIVEGVFDIQNYGLENLFSQEDLDYESHCIIRREIAPNGKSRAFVNDTPVRLDTLKELGQSLMDIHSQNENLSLGASTYQLKLLDNYGHTHEYLQAYRTSYDKFLNLQNRYIDLKEEALQLQKEADFNKFQLDELSLLNLEAGEQEKLEEEQEILDNAEEIKGKIQEILNSMQEEQFGSLSSLATGFQGLQQLSRYGQAFDALKERFHSVLIELNDIAATLEQEDALIEVDMEKLSSIGDRLSKIYQLQKKHGVATVEALIGLEHDLADKVFKVDHLDEQLKEIEQSKEKEATIMKQLGQNLSDKRKACTQSFAKELSALLHKLGMEKAVIEIVCRETKPSANGMDEVEFLFSANKGIAPQPIRSVASGGEFSRLMFAIKYIMADKTALPTLIFDEIDTGISGEVALQMVHMMQEIAKRHQVICISHLPQVAAKGDQHYFVYKDNSTEKTISKIKLLQNEERILEIAKMIAGSNPSSSAFESAKELLQK
ncbi:DNA repair protein RecN [Pararhodonellum marinum]|uniref:DNA repair protein RecN n=1 Tax=Pararhodonellum marinum TaxID=2755358 RepID=UPI00188F9601|nr:DNA repair protein RecN [Pararhodonellum marinum]